MTVATAIMRKCSVSAANICCSVCVKFGVGGQQIMQLGTHEFRDSRHKEGRNLAVGVGVVYRERC